MVSAIRRRIPPEDGGSSTATLVNLDKMVNLVNWPFDSAQDKFSPPKDGGSSIFGFFLPEARKAAPGRRAV